MNQPNLISYSQVLIFFYHRIKFTWEMTKYYIFFNFNYFDVYDNDQIGIDV